MKELADPAFLTALATLITAITALIKVFHVEKQTKSNQEVLQDVKQQTNGSMMQLKDQVGELRSHIDVLKETGYVGGHSDPDTGQSPIP